MLEFLHLPELTENYFTSFLFAFSAILVFFSADCWLLAKYPDKHKENIKLVDFLISRLRLMIPTVFCTFLVYALILSTLKAGFFCATLFSALSLYGSVFLFKSPNNNTKKHTLLFWLLMISGISIPMVVFAQYGMIIGIVVFICYILYGIILNFIFGKLEKSNNYKIEG